MISKGMVEFGFTDGTIDELKALVKADADDK